ncbi:MAG TPA: hypothetical protein VFW03_15245 [Gemmatimonadaceae bacterium]|nr:hypothetical protein [Gemmatimonadaceae bacterium]
MNANVDLRSMPRIATTPPLCAPWSNAAAAAARFVREPRRLPTFFGTPMIAHALSSRVPAPARLRALVAALRGRFAVANHPRAIRLPSGLATAVRALVRAGFDASALTDARDESPGRQAPPYDRARRQLERDPQTAFARRMGLGLLSTFPSAVRDELSGGVAWVALALCESATPAVRIDPSASSDAGTQSVAAIIEVDYHLMIAAGSNTPRDWPSLHDAAVAVPARAWPPHRHTRRGGAEPEPHDERRAWFALPLLVPDSWLAEHADPATLAHWARLTGRAGAPDRYWFPETWDRFLEPGRRIGWLTASDVWRPRRGRLASAANPDAEEGWSGAAGLRNPRSPLTPDLERGVGVPPGYALVRCLGLLSVGVLVDRDGR